MGAGTDTGQMVMLRIKQLQSLKRVGFLWQYHFLKLWQASSMKFVIHVGLKSDESPLLFTGTGVCKSLSPSIQWQLPGGHVK